MPLYRGFALRFLLAIAALALIHGIPLRKGKRASYATSASSVRSPSHSRSRRGCTTQGPRARPVRSLGNEACVRVRSPRALDRRTSNNSGQFCSSD